MHVPVPDTGALGRLAGEVRRIPAVTVATARALPELARVVVDDGRRRGTRTALRMSGAALSGASSVATSLLARRQPASAGEALLTPVTEPPAPSDDSGSFPDEAMAAGAPGAATDVADAAAARGDAGGGSNLSHDDLPLPDFDHMTIGSLRGKLRTLDVGGLTTLRAYEKAHADRIQVVTMLENRIAKLVREAGETRQGPSGEDDAASESGPPA